MNYFFSSFRLLGFIAVFITLGFFDLMSSKTERLGVIFLRLMGFLIALGLQRIGRSSKSYQSSKQLLYIFAFGASFINICIFYFSRSNNPFYLALVNLVFLLFGALSPMKTLDFMVYALSYLCALTLGSLFMMGSEFSFFELLTHLFLGALATVVSIFVCFLVRTERRLFANSEFEINSKAGTNAGKPERVGALSSEENSVDGKVVKEHIPSEAS